MVNQLLPPPLPAMNDDTEFPAVVRNHENRNTMHPRDDIHPHLTAHRASHQAHAHPQLTAPRRHAPEQRRGLSKSLTLCITCLLVAGISAATVAGLVPLSDWTNAFTTTASQNTAFSLGGTRNTPSTHWRGNALDPRLETPTAANQRKTFLARSTLIALDHAVRTGNYSVLHHLSDPSFQRQNPPNKLAKIFGTLKDNGVDLTFAAVQPLSLEPTPGPTKETPLNVTGRFATNTGDIGFDMRFVNRAGLWRLIGIVVAPIGRQQARL